MRSEYTGLESPVSGEQLVAAVAGQYDRDVRALAGDDVGGDRRRVSEGAIVMQSGCR